MGAFFQSRFDQSPVHEHLRSALEELSRLATEPWDPPAEQAVEYVDAVRAMIGYVRLRLGLQDPQVVTAAHLERLSADAGSVNAALQVFNTNRSLETAQAVHLAAEALVNSASMLPLALAPDEIKFAEATLDVLRRGREEASAALSSLATNAIPTLERAQASVDDGMQKLTESAETASTGLAAAAATAKAEVEATTTSLAAQRTAFEAKTAQFEQQREAAVKQINEALTGIESRYGETEKARLSQFTTTEAERSTAFSEFSRGAKAEYDELLRAVRETEARSENVLLLAGGAALSGRWIKQARDQRLERYFWLAALAIIAIGSVVFTFWNLGKFTAPADSSFVESVIFYFPRLPLAIITVTVLAFLIQQASRRSLWEARDRRVANELTAFPSFLLSSFLLSLEEADRTALARDVADRYFPGPQVDHDEPKHHEESPTTAAIPGGIYTLVGSLSSTAAMAIALIIALTR